MSIEAAVDAGELPADGLRPLGTIDAQTPIAAMTTFQVIAAHECAFAEQGLFLTASVSQVSEVNAFAFHRTLNPGADVVEYVLYEDWDTCDSFRTHSESPYLKRFHQAVQEFTLGEPMRKLYLGWFKWAAAPPQQGGLPDRRYSSDASPMVGTAAAAIQTMVNAAER